MFFVVVAFVLGLKDAADIGVYGEITEVGCEAVADLVRHFVEELEYTPYISFADGILAVCFRIYSLRL